MCLQTFFPLIFTTYTYQIVNMLFGMYFWITTAFVHTKNTYLFAKYLFGMYLQTFFPLIFTTCTYQIENMQFGMYFTDVLTAKVSFYTYYEKSQSTFSYILHSLSLHLILPHAMPPSSSFWIPNSEFFSLTTSFPPHNTPSPNSSFIIHNS